MIQKNQTKLAAVTAGIFALTLGLAACGNNADGNEENTTQSESPATSQSPTESEAAEPNPADTTTEAAAPETTESTPEAGQTPGTESDTAGAPVASDVALVEADYPSGYQYVLVPEEQIRASEAQQKALVDSTTYTPAECGQAAGIAQNTPPGSIVTVGVDQATGATLSAMVLPTTTDLGEIRSKVADCATFSLEIDSGAAKQSAQVNQKPLAVPDVSGAEIFGIEQETVSGDITAFTSIFIANKGANTAVVAASGPQAGDPAVLTDLLEKQLAKLS